MSKIVCAILASLLFFTTPAIAQTCAGSFPNTLTNGATADATQVMANFNYLLTCLNGLPPASAASTSSTRQTVAGGPVTTAGMPSFLPATAGGLSVASTNVDGTHPLAVTAANNADPTTGAQKDRLGLSTSNLTWGSLTASATNYLYVTVGAGGALTTGVTTVAPIYQQGGTPATANQQFTFNIGEMRGYLGNGSTAPQAYVVFVGEAVTSATAVTSTAAYAYNGVYDSGYTNTLPGAGAAVTKGHNIGVVPRLADFRVQCITAEFGYAVGDELGMGSMVTAWSTLFGVPSVSASRTSMTAITSNTGTNNWDTVNKSTGASFILTAANWKYRLIASRGW